MPCKLRKTKREFFFQRWKFTAETICLLSCRCSETSKKSWRCFVRSLMKTILPCKMSLFSLVFALATETLLICLLFYFRPQLSRFRWNNFPHFRVWSPYCTISRRHGVHMKFVCGNGGSRYALAFVMFLIIHFLVHSFDLFIAFLVVTEVCYIFKWRITAITKNVQISYQGKWVTGSPCSWKLLATCRYIG